MRPFTGYGTGGGGEPGGEYTSIPIREMVETGRYPPCRYWRKCMRLLFGRGVVTIPLILLVLLFGNTPAVSGAEIVIGPILQAPGDTTMTILWETDEASAGKVEYVARDGEGYAVSSGDSKTYHVVILTDLKAGQEYDYSIKDGDKTLYRARFHIIPSSDPYRAVIIGDTHVPSDGFLKLVPIIEELDPDFIIFLGDTVRHGDHPGDWLALFQAGRVLFDHIPVYTVVGDHERERDSTPSLYDHYFPRSNNPLRGPDSYEARIAGDRFIFLDVEKKKVAAMLWFFAALFDAGRKRDGHHIFVLSHKGITSYKGSRAGCWELRESQPLMAVCGVTALFSGHDHHYVRGRTYLGLPFFISGGGGGAPYEINEGSILAKFAGRMESSYTGLHFLVLDASPDHCTVRAVDEFGRTVDEVDLRPRRQAGG